MRASHQRSNKRSAMVTGQAGAPYRQGLSGDLLRQEAAARLTTGSHRPPAL